MLFRPFTIVVSLWTVRFPRDGTLKRGTPVRIAQLPCSELYFDRRMAIGGSLRPPVPMVRTRVN